MLLECLQIVVEVTQKYLYFGDEIILLIYANRISQCITDMLIIISEEELSSD